MSTQASALSTRLATLSDNNKATLHLVSRLAKLQFHSDHSDAAGGEEARAELTSEIHESLKQQESALELLEQEVKDATDLTAKDKSTRRRDDGRDRDRERTSLAVTLARVKEDLKQTRTHFRRAQLAAKRSAALAQQRARAQLFSSILAGTTAPGSVRTKLPSSLTAAQVAANASSDVTAALRQTQAALQHELSRSAFARETLALGSEQLVGLGDRYAGLDELLGSSRALLAALVSSRKSDTWYLETAFYILCATIAWLVFRRWLYGPLWWLVWVPLRLLLGAARVGLVAVGVVGGGGGGGGGASGLKKSLVVQPSATGGPPLLGAMQKGLRSPNVPVGRGGYGAGQRLDPSVQGSVSQRVGQMVEEGGKDGAGEEGGKGEADKLGEQQQGEEKEMEGEEKEMEGEEMEPARRGDGTVLEDSDAPRNPKKRMWDEDVEREKAKAAGLKDKDEL